MIEYQISRIISGYTRYRRPHTSLLIRTASQSVKMRALELAQDIYSENIIEGTGMNEDEYEEFIRKNRVWNDFKENKLKTLPEDLEELKVKYFLTNMSMTEADITKKLIQTVKNDIVSLFSEKNSYYHLTAKGMADSFRFKYIIGMGLYKENKKRLFETEQEYFDNSLSYFDDIISYYSKTRLSECDFRRIAQSEEWRVIWNCCKNENPFGKPAVKLTDEQRQLISWSKLYENVAKHPECPSESVIKDDDALDGWMIFQKRKRTEENEQKKFEEGLKGRLADAEEMFVQVNSQEEANRVYKMNSPESKAKINSRRKLIEQKGTISEFEMPDHKARLRMEYNKRRTQLENR